jgi:hypothetical protein
MLEYAKEERKTTQTPTTNKKDKKHKHINKRTILYKTLLRITQIDRHEPNKKGVNSDAVEGKADPAPIVVPITSCLEFHQCEQYIN